MIEGKDVEDFIWIRMGPRRTAILNCMHGMKMPSELRKELRMNFSCVSRILKEMKSRELVEMLVVPNQRNRMYTLTKKGQRIQDKIIQEKEERVKEPVQREVLSF